MNRVIPGRNRALLLHQQTTGSADLAGGCFGGYASFWHFCAERLVADPPEEWISYPLWESYLWEEWVKESGREPSPGSREAAAQRDPLSSVQILSNS